MFVKTVLIALSATLCAAILSPNVYRPCKLNPNDVACIQNSLRSSSRCRPPSGVVPSLLTVPRARFDTPAFNASYDDVNMVIRGLDRCFVSEYYLNLNTNTRLLAVDCPWLTIESNRVMYQHLLRREDAIFRYSINGTYPLITMNLPMTRPDLDLCQEFSNCHVHALPIYNISPQDRPTQNHLGRDLAALGVFEQETFAARAQFLARTFVNNKLCDFGCN